MNLWLELRSCLAVMCISVMTIMYSSAEEFTLSNRTTTGDSYYLGEPLSVTCKSSDVPATGSYLMYLVLDAEASNFRITCSREGDGPWEESNNNWPPSVPVDETQCNLPANENTMTARFDITEALSSLPITCRGFFTPGNSEIEVKPILIPPRNLTLSVDKDLVVENETITVSCQSDSPESYLYELIRESGEVTSLPGGSYTTSAADRDGFTVRCTEQGHSDWPVESDKVNTKEIRPRYISRDWNQVSPISIDNNPKSLTPLMCDIKGYPAPTYSWTSNTTDISSADASILTFVENSRDNGEVEEITCNGAVDGVGLSPLSITWRIMWDDTAPTNPPPIVTTESGPKPQTSAATIGGAVGGVIGAIIIIGIIGLCCWKKRKDDLITARKETGINLSDNGNTNQTGSSEMILNRENQTTDEYEEVAAVPNSPTSPDYVNGNIISSDRQTYENLPEVTRKPDNEYEKINIQKQQDDAHNYTHVGDWGK